MPGDEARARSVVQNARKHGIFLTGGRGKYAPFMEGTDFAGAIACVLHLGKVTEAGPVIERLWKLPLVTVSIDDPERIGPELFDAEDISKAGWEAPYIKQFGLDLWHPSNAIGVLSVLLEHYAATGKFFQPVDCVELQASGEKLSLKVSVRSGSPIGREGWRNSGPENSSLTVKCGDETVWKHGSYVRQTRAIYGDALNGLLELARRSDP